MFLACHKRHLIFCVALSHHMQRNGVAALLEASKKGNVEIVRTLIKNGASVDVKDKVRQLYAHVQCCVHRNRVSS